MRQSINWPPPSYADVEPSDVVDYGPLVCDFEYDLDDPPPIRAPAETITVRQKTKQGQSTPAQLEGTGWIESYNGSFPYGERRRGQFTIRWATEPVITPGV